jgi:acetylserotonin N-methyltransferase
MTDFSIVTDLIDAFRRSKAMFTAVSMGVFDQMPADLPTLAARLKANADALERLLDTCRGLGLLIKEEGVYRNTDVADAYLRRDSSTTLTGYILYSDQVLFKMWDHLEDAVKEGSHRWQQTFQLDGPIFSHFFKNEEAMRTFLMGMHGFGMISSPAVVTAFDLSGFRKLVDLGGATGHLPMAAKSAYPNLAVALFDLPPVIGFARELVTAEVELIPGDFFTDPLPPADLYTLGRILHDWSEPKIVTLLTKIYEALPPAGALLICEKLLDADKSGPVHVHVQSLNMLICTEGKERTLGEYAALLRLVGFTEVEGRQTGKPIDAVLARKR